MVVFKFAVLAAVAAAITCASGAEAATYPAAFEEETIVAGLTIPTMAAYAPDGRLFIIEKDGLLKVVDPNESSATTILDISGRVNSHHDRGLLGLAVDSSFAANGYVYLLYTYDVTPLTADSDGRMVSRLGRFTVSANNAVSAETVLLGSHVTGPCPPPSNTLDCLPSDGLSHSIGTVRSAPDGTLWVGSGDAASYHIVDTKAFDTYNEQSLAGKLMHIDRDGHGLPSHPFCPANTNLTHVCTKLHAKGFRNPFRFALRPNGGVTLGDVGWNEREEIDLIDEGGRSYGWPCYEGTIKTPGYQERDECSLEYAKEGGSGAHLAPNHDYRHDSSRSIMGGPTYTGTAYPGAYSGSIFFADYSGEFIRRLVPTGSGYSVQDFATNWSGTALEEGPDKNLFYPSFGDGGANEGSIRRIVYSPGNRTPTARASASPTSGPTTPLEVHFDAGDSTDPDGDSLTYSWNFGDGSPPSSLVAPSHTYMNPGTFTAQLAVSDGNKTASDTVRIDAGNIPPDLELTGDRTYRGGQGFSLSASASDAEDGPLPPGAFEWDVRVIHAAHNHFSASPSGVNEIHLTAVTDHDADSFYRAIVTVTDSDGATAQETVEVRPETTTVRLRSTPAGAPLSYGGIERITPQDISTTIGFRTTLTAPASFAQNGTIFDFTGWSTGGARLHDYSVPAQGGTLTASFRGRTEAPPSGGTVGGGGSGGDRTGPLLRVTRVSPRRGRVYGTALDKSGVRRVQVALRRPLKAGGCSWWLTAKKRMASAARRCDRPRWLPAALTETADGVSWLAETRTPLPAGRYRVVVRAFDSLSNPSQLESGKNTLVRVGR